MTTYFNNPAIGQGFANLAAGLAPPSGADTAGYAKAQAIREEAARIAEMYDLAKAPDADMNLADRLNYAVRGKAQDTFRYGEQDRLAAQQRQDSINQTDITQSLISPLGPNQSRIIPGSVAEMYGLPPVQMGNVQLGQGERSFNADGSTYDGQVKPKSETEVKGDILSRQDQAIQDAIIFGNTPIEQIPGAGGAPVNVTRPQSLGQPAWQKPGETFNAQTPDGRTTLAMQDPVTGAPIDAVTRQPLPAGTSKVSKVMQGTPDQMGATTGNRSTAGNIKAAVSRIRVVAETTRQLIKSSPTAGVSGTPGRVFGFTRNAVQSLKEMSSAFGNDGPVSFDEWQRIIDEAVPQDQSRYDPIYAQVRTAIADLAYAVAQGRNPNGEVGRYALQGVMESLGQGFLGNDADLLAVLDQVEASTEALLAQANTLETGEVVPMGAPLSPEALARMPGVARPAPAAPGGLQPGVVEDGYRFLGGDPGSPQSWERVQ